MAERTKKTKPKKAPVVLDYFALHADDKAARLSVYRLAEVLGSLSESAEFSAMLVELKGLVNEQSRLGNCRVKEGVAISGLNTPLKKCRDPFATCLNCLVAILEEHGFEEFGERMLMSLSGGDV